MKKVGIAGCSNPLKLENIKVVDGLITYFKALGLEPVVSNGLFENKLSYIDAGKSRAKALMQMYEDPQIQEIFDVSGGDMANQVLPYLDYEVIKNSPARFWGYSDLTTLINAIYTKTGKASVLWQVRHTVSGNHANLQQQRFMNVFNDSAISMEDVADSLFFPQFEFLQGEAIEGTLIGGNIRCFLKLAGTEYFPDLTDKILFLEAMGGDLPQMATYLAQLDQLGAFGKVKGILLGTFTQLQAAGYTDQLIEMIRAYAGADMPFAKTEEVGHGDEAKAVVIGAPIALHA